MKILFVVVVVVAVALAAVVNVVNDVINVKDVEIAPASDDDVVVVDGDGDIVWFLQITDIHLSIFQDGRRKGSLAEFRTFCGETVKTIGPAAVVASGDLTDAKTRDRLGSRQYKQVVQVHTVRSAAADNYTNLVFVRSGSGTTRHS